MTEDTQPGRRSERFQGRTWVTGHRAGESTTDSRLLDNRGPSDWVHTDPWRVVTAAPLPSSRG